MAIRSIAIPEYLLDEDVITALLAGAEEVATELAGESETPELPPLIARLRDLLRERAETWVVFPAGPAGPDCEENRN